MEGEKATTLSNPLFHTEPPRMDFYEKTFHQEGCLHRKAASTVFYREIEILISPPYPLRALFSIEKTVPITENLSSLFRTCNFLFLKLKFFNFTLYML